jgi:formylglycine-generating enzyme required for sulfatase activity
MDRHPVTVREFRRFVRDTGYVTVAERPLDPENCPDADPYLLVPGALVFRPRPGREVGSPGGPAERHVRARRSSGHADRVRGRGRLRRVGGQGAGGEFPWQRTGAPGTVPAGSYPPNGYGLHEMTGNVWEWTCDEPANGHAAEAPCCGPAADETIPRRVIKGGSYLCAPNRDG